MELEVSKLQAHPKPYEISRLDSSISPVIIVFRKLILVVLKLFGG